MLTLSLRSLTASRLTLYSPSPSPGFCLTPYHASPRFILSFHSPYPFPGVCLTTLNSITPHPYFTLTLYFILSTLSQESTLQLPTVSFLTQAHPQPIFHSSSPSLGVCLTTSDGIMPHPSSASAYLSFFLPFSRGLPRIVRRHHTLAKLTLTLSFFLPTLPQE